jgi:hypothetical protein
MLEYLAARELHQLLQVERAALQDYYELWRFCEFTKLIDEFYQYEWLELKAIPWENLRELTPVLIKPVGEFWGVRNLHTAHRAPNFSGLHRLLLR